MMQESGTEATSNGPANQNGGASVEGGAREGGAKEGGAREGGAREGRLKSGTPSMELAAAAAAATADLLTLQQHQVDQAGRLSHLPPHPPPASPPPQRVPLNI